MLKTGELVRIVGYQEAYDGLEGILTRDQTGSHSTEVAYFDVTKVPKGHHLYNVGSNAAMYFKNLERVCRPEEMICEDWS